VGVFKFHHQHCTCWSMIFGQTLQAFEANISLVTGFKAKNRMNAMTALWFFLFFFLWHYWYGYDMGRQTQWSTWQSEQIWTSTIVFLLQEIQAVAVFHTSLVTACIFQLCAMIIVYGFYSGIWVICYL
jgi:hypothetical protein